MPASYRLPSTLLLGLWLGLTEVPLLVSTAIAAPATAEVAQPAAPMQIVVNSNQDGPIQPDAALTLREAIALVNGTLNPTQLSADEQAQVTANESADGSRITFNLPSTETTIYLKDLLPAIDSPGLVIDGTTQPGYDANQSATAEIAIPTPLIAITPAAGQEIFRGLTVVSDRVTIRGLSLYGFTSRHRATASTPPADIFIAHRFPPPDTRQQQPPTSNAPFSRDNPPQGVVIENNWLGLPPDENMPLPTSAFGVSIFNGVNTTVRRNRIAYHDGSGIITGVRAENSQVQDNIIVGNGIAGMPDAIRLEGIISGTQIASNLICGNDGSGIYLFKPEGSVQIQDNQLKFNGRRLRRAAVYLMGSEHQVRDNQIGPQTGPGVVIAAYPRSDRNIIENNQFNDLEGLSIDLNTRNNVGVQDYQRGDGPNPRRNSANRRQDTANSAINAPQLRNNFPVTDGQVTIAGKADRGSQVTLYRVAATTPANAEKRINLFPGYAPLAEPIATVETDDQGQFSTTLSDLQPGTQISAIATDLRYGTSEPAAIATIGDPSTASVDPPASATTPPRCTTPPIAQTPPTEPPVVEIPTPEPIRLRVPRNVHFALDEDTISPASAAVLDQIATVLRDYPFIVVEIEGHTDPRASDAYNLDLGRRRALSARNYLLRRGIAPERMTIRSLGEQQRITTGSDRLDYARDRRAEFSFRDVRGIEIVIERQENDLQIER